MLHFKQEEITIYFERNGKAEYIVVVSRSY